jgi:hypothetical protein
MVGSKIPPTARPSYRQYREKSCASSPAIDRIAAGERSERASGYEALPLTAEMVTITCVCWISSFTSMRKRRRGPRATT